MSRSSSLLRLAVAARTHDEAAVDEEMDAVASEYSGEDAEATIDELAKSAPPGQRKVVRDVLKRKLAPRLKLKKLYGTAARSATSGSRSGTGAITPRRPTVGGSRCASPIST